MPIDRWWSSSTRSTARPTRPSASHGSQPASVPSTPTVRERRWWSTRRAAFASRRCEEVAPARTATRSLRRRAARWERRSWPSPATHRGTSVGRSSGCSVRPPSTSARWRKGVLDGYAVTGGSRLGSWDYLGSMLVCREAGAFLIDRDGDGAGHTRSLRSPSASCRCHAGPAGRVLRRSVAVAWLAANGRLAQLVEQLAYNQQVVGSSPAAPTASGLLCLDTSLRGRTSPMA